MWTGSWMNICLGLPRVLYRKLLPIFVLSYFPFGFEGRMWELIVSLIFLLILLPLTFVLAVVTHVKTPKDHQRSIPCWLDHVLDRTILHQDSLLKSLCFKRHVPLKTHRLSSLSYSCFILLSLSADVELNPGPVDFLYGNCALKL